MVANSLGNGILSGRAASGLSNASHADNILIAQWQTGSATAACSHGAVSGLNNASCADNSPIAGGKQAQRRLASSKLFEIPSKPSCNSSFVGQPNPTRM